MTPDTTIIVTASDGGNMAIPEVPEYATSKRGIKVKYSGNALSLREKYIKENTFSTSAPVGKYKLSDFTGVVWQFIPIGGTAANWQNELRNQCKRFESFDDYSNVQKQHFGIETRRYRSLKNLTNKMKVKHIQAAQALYSDIVQIDDEIVAIQKRATQLAKTENKVKLSLCYPESAEEKVESILDEDGNLVSKIWPTTETENSIRERLSEVLNGSFRFVPMPGGFLTNPNIPPAPKTVTDNYELSEVEALICLEALVNFKREKRYRLLKQLEQLGFEVLERFCIFII